MSTRITIITPSFNQAAFLEQTIRSVLDQNYPNLQFGIVDGGSTDGSVEIIERYRDQLAFAIVEPDRGQVDAINKGFRRAVSRPGDVIGWLCADDTLLPGALDVIAAQFADPDTHWIAGACRVTDAQGCTIETQRPFGDFSLAGILLRPDGLLIPQPGVWWRQRLLDRVGLLDPSLHYALDFDLWCRFAADGCRPRIIGRELATYRLHEQSKTCSQRDGFLREHLVIEQRHGRRLPLPLRLRLTLRLGYQRRMLAVATARSRRELLRQILTRPWWLGSQQIRAALKQAA
jgi:glycosyltransferase involved in cell wall biosynthesis